MSDAAIAMTSVMFTKLSEDVQDLQERVRKQEVRQSIARAFAFPEVALADAPTGLSNSQNRWITDGRKPGETAGNGTGVPAYFDPTADEWQSYLSGTAVQT